MEEDAYLDEGPNFDGDPPDLRELGEPAVQEDYLLYGGDIPWHILLELKTHYEELLAHYSSCDFTHLNAKWQEYFTKEAEWSQCVCKLHIEHFEKLLQEIKGGRELKPKRYKKGRLPKHCWWWVVSSRDDVDHGPFASREAAESCAHFWKKEEYWPTGVTYGTQKYAALALISEGVWECDY